MGKPKQKRASWTKPQYPYRPTITVSSVRRLFGHLQEEFDALRAANAMADYAVDNEKVRQEALAIIENLYHETHNIRHVLLVLSHPAVYPYVSGFTDIAIDDETLPFFVKAIGELNRIERARVVWHLTQLIAKYGEQQGLPYITLGSELRLLILYVLSKEERDDGLLGTLREALVHVLEAPEAIIPPSAEYMPGEKKGCKWYKERPHKVHNARLLRKLARQYFIYQQSREPIGGRPLEKAPQASEATELENKLFAAAQRAAKENKKGKGVIELLDEMRGRASADGKSGRGSGK